MYSVWLFLGQWTDQFLICYFRTLTLAKSIIKDKLSVRSKKDKVIDLSKDEKIEKVSVSFFSRE